MKKWRVRADCRPPKTFTPAGNTELKPGDNASPVQITKGKKTKITARYVIRCTALYENASARSGRLKRMCLAITVRNDCQVLSPGAGNRLLRKWPVDKPQMA